MTNKYRKSCSVSTTTNKMQLKTALRLLFTLVRLATTTKANTRDLGWRAGLHQHTHYSMGISMGVAIQVRYTPPVYILKEFQVSTPQRYLCIHVYYSTSHTSHILEHAQVPINKFRRKCICIQILCGHKNEPNGIFKKLNENLDDYVKHKSHTQTNITRDTNFMYMCGTGIRNPVFYWV